MVSNRKTSMVINLTIVEMVVLVRIFGSLPAAACSVFAASMTAALYSFVLCLDVKMLLRYDKLLSNP